MILLKQLKLKLGKDESDIVTTTVLARQTQVVGGANLTFRVNTSANIRVYVLNDPATPTTTFNIMGGNFRSPTIGSGHSSTGYYSDGVIFTLGPGSNLKCMVGGSVSRIIMVPLDPSETLTDSKAQLTIESFGDIHGNLEIEGVTNVECGDPTSSIGKKRVTMKYLYGRFKIYNFEN